MKHRLSLLVTIIIAGLVMTMTNLALAQTSSNYDLSWSTISSGGNRATSTNYTLHSVVGQFGVDTVSSNNNTLWGGFLSVIRVWRSFLPIVLKNFSCPLCQTSTPVGPTPTSAPTAPPPNCIPCPIWKICPTICSS
jgi:hypothetical protein